jgi:hypothetical protein
MRFGYLTVRDKGQIMYGGILRDCSREYANYNCTIVHRATAGGCGFEGERTRWMLTRAGGTADVLLGWFSDPPRELSLLYLQCHRILILLTFLLIYFLANNTGNYIFFLTPAENSNNESKVLPALSWHFQVISTGHKT